MTATALPALPEDLPTALAAVPVTDRHGFAWATSTVHVSITRAYPSGEPVALVTALEAEPNAGEDSPEGFAEILLPLSALQALADGLPAVLDALRTLGAAS